MSDRIIKSDQPAAMGIHYHYYSLRYMLESQKNVGYQSIELYCATPHVAITSEGIAEKNDLIKKIRESGLKVKCVTPDNCNGPWQYAAKEKETIRQCKRYFTYALELAEDLDCPIVACHSGWGLLDEPKEEAWKRSLSFMNWYCEEARKHGIMLVMESLRAAETNLVNSLPSLVNYFDELDNSNIYPMIDTCAMSVAGETMEEWFQTFGSRICHMHFVDGTPYYHLAWGDGNRSLDEYMNTIQKYHYHGTLTQEITDVRYFEHPEKADEQSYKILKQYM